MRDEYTEYEQDRFGNERKKLDQLRAQEGMRGADADNEGIEDIAAGDTGTDVVVYTLPDHADQVMLDLIHAHNNSGAAGTFRVLEATLDSNGNITNTTRRSVLINVADAATRTIGYEGEPFTQDAIVVNSGFEGEFGFAVIADHPEHFEADSENY